MVKHIILWTLNPELSEEEKKKVKAEIKAGLEGLVGKVPGLLDVKVHIDGRLASSNADLMLDSTRESEEALKGYAVHPGSSLHRSTLLPRFRDLNHIIETVFSICLYAECKRL